VPGEPATWASTSEARYPGPDAPSADFARCQRLGTSVYLYWMEESVENREAPVSEALASSEECELCGAEMFGLHCKLVCPNCGYRRDCSDP
jgi:hypothetical protein